MARLRLGLLGLLLVVLAATGFGPGMPAGDPGAARTLVLLEDLLPAGADATAGVTVAEIDDHEDGLGTDRTGDAPAFRLSATPPATTGHRGPRPALPPRATGPPTSLPHA